MLKVSNLPKLEDVYPEGSERRKRLDRMSEKTLIAMKKNEENKMAKKIETNITVISKDVVTVLPTNKAFSIVYNGNKRYSVIAVTFNPKENVVGNIEVIESGLDLYEAQHVFKTETVKAGLFDEGIEN